MQKKVLTALMLSDNNISHKTTKANAILYRAMGPIFTIADPGGIVFVSRGAAFFLAGGLKMNEKQFLSPAEMAKVLSISLPTAYRWISRGVVPVHKFQGLLRVAKEDLRHFIKSAKRA